jgi:hypothetical protein
MIITAESIKNFLKPIASMARFEKAPVPARLHRVGIISNRVNQNYEKQQ